MSRYRKIDTRIWNDAKFRDFTDHGKLAFLFLLTHPHMTAIGAMRASIPGMAAELGWPTEAFQEAFQEALSKGMAEHDEKVCLVWLPNFLKYNGPESPNVVKAWGAALDLIPECVLKDKAIQYAKAFTEGMTEAFAKALPEAFRKAMPYQEQEQEQERTLSTANAVEVPGAAGSGVPDCPHQKIIALYHELLPMNPRVVEWNETRQGYLRARWCKKAKAGEGSSGYTTEAEGLAWWRKFLEWAGQSKFLTGQTEGRDGKAPFLPNLEWIVRPTNFSKIIEGNYHRG